MKKLLSLVLVLVVAMVAFAEAVPSITASDLIAVETESVVLFTITEADATVTAVVTALEEANDAATTTQVMSQLIGEEKMAAVVEYIGSDFTITDVVGIQFTEAAAEEEESESIFKFTFVTPFEANEKVVLVFMVVDGVNVYAESVEVIALEDGSVEAAVPASLIEKSIELGIPMNIVVIK